jgi:hypothetical protein
MEDLLADRAIAVKELNFGIIERYRIADFDSSEGICQNALALQLQLDA